MQIVCVVRFLPSSTSRGYFLIFEYKSTQIRHFYDHCTKNHLFYKYVLIKLSKILCRARFFDEWLKKQKLNPSTDLFLSMATVFFSGCTVVGPQLKTSRRRANLGSLENEIPIKSCRQVNGRGREIRHGRRDFVRCGKIQGDGLVSNAAKRYVHLPRFSRLRWPARQNTLFPSNLHPNCTHNGTRFCLGGWLVGNFQEILLVEGGDSEQNKIICHYDIKQI